MMGRITTSDLHGYLIDERSSGSLSEIPATLYEEIQADMVSLRAQAAASDDPFGEGAQSLIKERESLREYLRDLYAVRTQKILNLALARANGDEIDRSELQMMVPGERALFEVVFESCTSCRKALLDGKPTLEITAYSYVSPNAGTEQEASPSLPPMPLDAEIPPEEAADFLMENVAGPAPESYSVLSVHSTIPEFQDYNGRIYSLSPGDVVSLPPQMADILCKDNKALSIRIRK